MVVGIICVAGAVLAAFGAGWCLGRANPSWELDQANEDVEYLRHRGFGRGWGWGLGFREPGYGYTGGLVSLMAGFMRGTGLMALFVIAAIALGVFGFDRVPGIASSENPAAWIALDVAALTGYVISRVTDKGPVGPLE